MAKRKPAVKEMQDIREDIDILKDDMVSLVQHMQENSNIRLREAGDKLREKVEIAQDNGVKELQKLETRVQEKPGQSVLLAFCAGMALSKLVNGATQRRYL